MANLEPKQRHRLKKIIVGFLIVPITLFLLLLIIGFIMNVRERSRLISQGDYSKINQILDNKTNANLYNDEQKKLIEGLGNPSFGVDNPQLTIVQFADFACPYCKSSFTNLRELVSLYQDRVKIIFRDWPGHEHSLNLALAAHCAGEQNKFWEMHDKLYLNQAVDFGANKNDLAVLANELGIYNEQFQTCFDNQKYLFRIQKNIIDGEELGVKGTPTWFFNGEKFGGELSKADLAKIIQQYVK